MLKLLLIRLQDSHPIYLLADQYCLQITVPISAIYYPITSTFFVYIYRASRATFTIKSFMQFFTLQSLQITWCRNGAKIRKRHISTVSRQTKTAEHTQDSGFGWRQKRKIKSLVK